MVMNIKFFRDELTEHEALNIQEDHIDKDVSPNVCFRTVRETMEELAYRTAVTYTDNGTPSLYYQTTLKGISCYEVGTRDNDLGRVSLPSEEPRLLG